METILPEQGFELISYKESDWLPELQKGWNDNLLIVYEELAGHFPLAKDAPPNFPMPRETYQAMFDGVMRECAEGVFLHQPVTAVLAKKP